MMLPGVCAIEALTTGPVKHPKAKRFIGFPVFLQPINSFVYFDLELSICCFKYSNKALSSGVF